MLIRLGIIGIKVRIMLDHDPEGKKGPNVKLPDQFEIKEPKEQARVVKTQVCTPDEKPSQ